MKKHQKIVEKKRKSVQLYHTQFINSTAYSYFYGLILGCLPESHFLDRFTFFDSLFFFLVVQKSPLNFSTIYYCSTSLVAQMAKNLPAMWETWVQCLSRIDPLRREWLPTPVFLPGEFHGQRSLVGYGPWGHKESDMAEKLTLSHSLLLHQGYLENCSTCAQLWSW